jgi:flagellar biogenesis protein FliO
MMNSTSNPHATPVENPATASPRLSQWIQAALRSRFRWMGAGRAARRMQLLETLNLGGRRQLMLVVCDGQSYLVGAGGDSVHSLTSLPGLEVHPAGSPLLPRSIECLPHHPMTELTQ